ncbi:MAG: hypothetical protein KJ061_12570 [Vicinamibacteraceae bacterium]|nr:hypothetical protein [Vicinamibacteraceae bacterium]
MKRALLALAFAAAVLPSPVQATTVRALTTEAMTREADVIAIGQCVAVETVWEDRVLVTKATIEVSESLKGGASGRIVVSLPGGIDTNRKHPIAMTYPGAPIMQPGERVFVFLDRGDTDPSAFTVSGFSQGKFSIVVDPAGEEVVTRDLSQITLVGGPGPTRGAKDRKRLADFRREVRTILGR